MKIKEDIAREVCRLCVKKIAPAEARFFDKLWALLMREVGLSGIAELGTADKLEQLGVRDPGLLPPTARRVSLNLIKVVVCIVDAAFERRKLIGEKEFARLLSECMKSVGTPSDMKPLLGQHLCMMFKGSFKEGDLPFLPEGLSKPYIVYLQDEFKPCEEHELGYYRRLGETYAIDIFIDDVDKAVKIKGHPAPFRPGNNYPYVILRFLLTRVGEDVEYEDIFSAIKPWVRRPLKDGRTKFVYQQLIRIEEGLEKMRKDNPNISPDWFKRLTGAATVHVSGALNSCLIMRA
jgi:hypothetical protein